MSWGPEKLLMKCGRESQHSAESWAPWPPVEHQENEKDTKLTAIRVGVNILHFCSVSSSLSHTNVTIKWEVYFVKEVFARPLSLCRCDSFCMYISIFIIWLYNTTSHKYLNKKKIYPYCHSNSMQFYCYVVCVCVFGRECGGEGENWEKLFSWQYFCSSSYIFLKKQQWCKTRLKQFRLNWMI